MESRTLSDAPSRPAPAASNAVNLETRQKSRVQRRERRLVWQMGAMGWLCIDAGVAVVSVLFAFILSPFSDVLALDPNYLAYLPTCLSFAGLLGVVAHIAGLHDPRIPRVILDLMGRVCLVVGLTMMILNLILVIVLYQPLGRYVSAY
ncbi:MAG TPA: hypothetical protein VIY86_04280, partial [Pirellulaceae bacterium]